MAKCEICDKKISFGIRVSHSHRRSNRTWKANIQRIKVETESGNHKKIYACTSCIRSTKKA